MMYGVGIFFIVFGILEDDWAFVGVGIAFVLIA